MASFRRFMVVLSVFVVLSAHGHQAQPPPSSTLSSRALDALLQGYAYAAFGPHPHTGVLYDGAAPANLSGVAVSAARLRSGSLRTRGLASFKEFSIPVGVAVNPHVERLVLVYQNLGNWSSVCFPLPGYSYLAPVLGLLAYNAANLSATNLPYLDLDASESPITIEFKNLVALRAGGTPRCVSFDPDDGSPEFSELVSGSICSTRRQGHFSVVANSSGLAPSPAPSEGPPSGPSPSRVRRKSHTKVWAIVGGVVGGSAGLVLLSLVILWLLRHFKGKKFRKMAHNAQEGESLRAQRVGNARLPAASTTRTPPTLENEYVVA